MPRALTDGKNHYVIVRLAALCFFLSTIEFMIPRPLPFLRLGLANVPVMLAADMLSPVPFATLVALKVLGQGIVGGTLFSYVFLFSLAGTAASSVATYALRRALGKRVSFVGTSVAAAFASNATQLALARVFVFGEGIAFVAPPFLALGVVTGAALGFATNRFASRSRWYAGILDGTVPGDADNASAELTPALRPGAGTRLRVARAARLSAGLLLTAFILFAPDARIKAVLALAAAVLLVSGGGKIRLLPTLSISLGIVYFNLLSPFGRVLAEPFGLPVTAGALETGVKKALALEGMLFASRWALSAGVSLPGRAGSLMSRIASFLSYLTRCRPKLDRKDLVASVDAIMFGPE